MVCWWETGAGITCTVFLQHHGRVVLRSSWITSTARARRCVTLSAGSTLPSLTPVRAHVTCAIYSWLFALYHHVWFNYPFLAFQSCVVSGSQAGSWQTTSQPTTTTETWRWTSFWMKMEKWTEIAPRIPSGMCHLVETKVLLSFVLFIISTGSLKSSKKSIRFDYGGQKSSR